MAKLKINNIASDSPCLRISFYCPQVIDELMADIAEFGAHKSAYGVFAKREVKVPFSEKTITIDLLVDYLLGDSDPTPEELGGGWAELSTLGDLLEVFEQENKTARTEVTNEFYNFLIFETKNYTDIDAYVSDMALSSEWGDDESDPIPEKRIKFLRELFLASHRSIKEIAALAGLSVRQLRLRFAIPRRTVDCWVANPASAPVYTLLMMQECLSIIDINLDK